MSKKLITISGALAASIVAAGVIINTNVKGNDDTLDMSSSTATVVAKTDDKTLVDETIYVFTKADGSVRKVISSDWTKNLGIDEFTKTEKSSNEAPIDLKISYKLDGEPIDANKLSGKSGRVTIRFDYTNKERVSGYYFPYLVMTGAMLDNENFSNVEVKNGKTFNDGSRTIVAGFALPGMQENLGLSTSAYEIPNYVEITADTTNFKLGMTMSLATSEIFTDIDTSNLDSASNLSSELTKLTAAMDKLIGGSSDLYNGIDQLYNETAKLPEGVTTLKAGSTKLTTGTKQLDAGADKLANGLAALYDGINTQLVSNNASLQQGATLTYNSILKTTHDTIEAKASAASIAAGGEAVVIPNFTIDNWSDMLDYLTATYPNFATDLATAKNQLTLYDTFYKGVYNYTNGVATTNETIIKGQLLAGAAELKAGASTLATGAEQLDAGLSTLDESAPKLVDGIGKLRDGSAQLKDGLKQFNDEGISKLVNAYSNIDELLTRVKTIANIAKGNQKPIKYIYRTDEVK